MLLELKHLLIDVYSLTLGYFNNSGKRIYWIYLLTSLVLATYVYFKYKKKQKENKTLLQFLFPKENYLGKTAFIDYSFFIFNTFVKLFVIASFSYYSKLYSFEFKEWLLEHFGMVTNDISFGTITLIYLVSLLIIGDFSYYILHLLYHKVPFLWAFHKVHHSSTALNPITQYRIHPIELTINNLRVISILTISNGFFDYLNNGYFTPQTYLGVNIIVLLFYSWGSNLRHSHIKLTYFTWLENLLISPFQHQIHHSSQKEFFNKNLGSKLAIWDKLFGTLVKSKEIETLKVGLGEKDKYYKSFWQNIINPFKSIFNSKY